jgi:RNA polymerase sigma-70 factor (ECF subfamily)
MLILLTFASEDDRVKFELLFEKYKKLLLHKAYAILGDYALAEDAASEAYLRIYRNMRKIGDIESPSTVSFLVTIVKNTSLDILQKQKKYFASVKDDEPKVEAYSEAYNIEETILSAAITSDMLKIVDNLKEELRAPFLLKYAHDLPYKEIAALLHISENNVTVRIHRAKSKLAELFKEAGYA